VLCPNVASVSTAVSPPVLSALWVVPREREILALMTDGLVQLSRLVQGAFARIADRHHLTPVQGRLLCLLAQGPRGMTELARCCGVEKAALTGLVDRAERRGLAERTPVPGDRRALRVTLTDVGDVKARRNAKVAA
jgi:DNA-binding MarR family transcriptional regulator